MKKKQDDEPNSPNSGGETVKDCYRKPKTSKPGVDIKLENTFDYSQSSSDGYFF